MFQEYKATVVVIKENDTELRFPIFRRRLFGFKPFVFEGYLDSDGVPHHSFDVFFHGESIPDRFTVVRALYLSTSALL